jgi:hypothetical protein
MLISVAMLAYSVDCEFLVFRGGILSDCLMLGDGGYIHTNHFRNFSRRTCGATAGESRCVQATDRLSSMYKSVLLLSRSVVLHGVISGRW